MSKLVSMTAAQLKDAEVGSLSYIVDNFIAEDCLMILAGKPKMFKTFMVLNIAISVSCGLPVFNRYPSKQTVVAYVSMEERMWRIKGRIEKMMQYYNTDWPENFHIYDRIESVEDLERLQFECGAGLIIIDTFAAFKLAVPMEYREEYKFMLRVREAISGKGCSVLGVHHTRKNPEEISVENVTDEISGTYGILGGTDTAAVVIKPKGKSPELHVVSRDFETWSAQMRFDKENFIWSREDEPTRQLLGDRPRVIDMLRRAQFGLTFAEIKSKLDHKNKDAVEKMLQRMKADDQVFQDIDGRYQLATTMETPDVSFKREREYKINPNHATPFEVSNEPIEGDDDYVENE